MALQRASVSVDRGAHGHAGIAQAGHCGGQGHGRKPNVPDVAAACSFTACRSRLKALSVAPERWEGGAWEAYLLATTWRKVGDAMRTLRRAYMVVLGGVERFEDVVACGRGRVEVMEVLVQALRVLP